MVVASINLIPLTTRRSLEIRGIAKGWATLLSVVLVACISIGAIADNRLQQQRALVDALAETCYSTEQLMQRVTQLSSHKQRLAEVEGSLTRLIPGDDLLQTLGAIATATNADPTSSTKLRQAHIAIQNAQVPNSDFADALPPATAAHVNLTIWGENDREIQSCLEKLRNSPRFREVRIRTSSQDSLSDQRQIEVDAFVYVTKEVPK